VDAVVALSLQVTLDEISAAMTAVGIAPRNRPLPEQVTEANEALAAERAEVETDELVTCAREYTRQSWAVLQTIRPILASRRDQEGVSAAEQIEELCMSVASKIFRAVSSARDPDVAADDLQSDANGSAKVALLVIEESRQAWRVLLAPGRGVANGTPAKFLVMLDALERDVLARFPRAFEFIRPGFDTGELGGEEAGLAKALRELIAPRAN
jgi:hypothetical protein